MQLRRKEFHRLARTLAWGATSVGGRWRTGRPARVADKPALSIIGWGDASIGAGGPISRAGIGPSRAFEAFCRSNYPSICFVRVSEYCTSRVCTGCWELRPRGGGANLVVDGSPRHKLLVCTNHNHRRLVVDRDVSAGVAMMAVLLGALFEEHVPHWPDS